MGMPKNFLLCAGLAAALVPWRTFAADTAAAASGELEEITVTAEKRSESQQNVPLSMTTFSSAVLQQKEINTFFDYATKVPNLAFAPTGDGVSTARTVSIRGISGDNVTGFYIDDTPLPDSIDPRVLDIDHIEVLRGPQGTLYGARSMGGVVRIITKEPDLNDFSADVHGGVSSTHRTDQPNYTGDGVLNIPLIPDHVALRLSGFYDTEAGYFKRSFCSDPAAAMALTCTPLAASRITTVNDVGEINTYGGTASLHPSSSATPSPSRRALLLQKASYNGFPMADYLSEPGNGIGYPVPSGPYTLPTPLEPTPGFAQARMVQYPARAAATMPGDCIPSPCTGRPASANWCHRRPISAAPCGRREDRIRLRVPWPSPRQRPAASPQPGAISEEKSYQRFVQEARFASDLPRSGAIRGRRILFRISTGVCPFAAYYPPATVPNLDNTLGGQNNPDYANLIFAQDFHHRHPRARGHR